LSHADLVAVERRSVDESLAEVEGGDDHLRKFGVIHRYCPESDDRNGSAFRKKTGGNG
jgi:hypothetical protein